MNFWDGCSHFFDLPAQLTKTGKGMKIFNFWVFHPILIQELILPENWCGRSLKWLLVLRPQVLAATGSGATGSAATGSAAKNSRPIGLITFLTNQPDQPNLYFFNLVYV